MAKLLKVLLGLMAIVIVLAVLAVLVLPRFIDPNQFRGLIAEQVQKHTGRTLAIKGDLKPTVFPWLGVSVGQLEVGPAQGFGPEPMVSVAEAQVRVKLLPLLSGQAEVDTVVLRQPIIRVGRDKSGRTAWDDIVQKLAAPQAQPDKAPAEKAPSQSKPGGPAPN